MIRLIIALLVVVLYLVLTLPVLLVLWIVGLTDKTKKDMWSLHCIKFAFRMLLFVCGTKVDVIGEENIPTDRAVLYIGNHRSIFDILINYINMKRPSGFISKIEIKKVPIFNIWMKNIGCLFLDRDNIKQGMQTILDAVNSVKNGTSIFIFPEGTRSKVEGEFGQFKGGSFKIAEKSNCDIVPVSIVNSGAIFEDHKPFVKKTHVIVEYCKPIPTAGLDKEAKKALPDDVRNIIIEAYNRNREAI